MADLITATEYKTYAGISDSGQDTIIGVLIDVVSEQVRLYCLRDRTTGFESTSRTEYHDGQDAAEIQLREWPVTALTSVAIVEDDGALTTVATTDVRYQGPTGRLSYLGSLRGRFVRTEPYAWTGSSFGDSPAFPSGINNVKVVYTGGYSTIPDAIKYACYRAIDVAMANRGANPGFQSESLGGYSYTRAQASTDIVPGMLHPEVKGLLAPFRTFLP